MSILPDFKVFNPDDKNQLRFYVKCPSDIARDEEAYTHLIKLAMCQLLENSHDYVVKVKIRDRYDDGSEYLEFTATPKA